MNTIARPLVFLAAMAALLLAVPTASAAVKMQGKKWPKGKTIKVYDGAPKDYRWSVNYAIKHYNEIGAKVKFKRVSKKKQADVTVSYKAGKKMYAPGVASVGRQSKRAKNFVWLDRNYGGSRSDYVLAMLVVHEFGHVLGLGHPTKAKDCSVMNSNFFGACKIYQRIGVGQWACGLVQPMELKVLQRAYGKRKSKVKKQFCEIPAEPVGAESRPGQLNFVGGEWVFAPWDAEMRTYKVDLSFPAFKVYKSNNTSEHRVRLQRIDAACAGADWAADGAYVAPWVGAQEVWEFSPEASALTDYISGRGLGGVVCYRLVSEVIGIDGSTTTHTSESAEVAFGADPEIEPT